jgi:hypothetical protein
MRSDGVRRAVDLGRGVAVGLGRARVGRNRGLEMLRLGVMGEGVFKNCVSLAPQRG